jgi:hypothetical protein
LFQWTPVQEAIARFVDYDEWFFREVEKGLASADRGDLLTHEEVGTRLEKLIAEKQGCAKCYCAGRRKGLTTSNASPIICFKRHRNTLLNWCAPFTEPLPPS